MTPALLRPPLPVVLGVTRRQHRRLGRPAFVFPIVFRCALPPGRTDARDGGGWRLRNIGNTLMVRFDRRSGPSCILYLRPQSVRDDPMVLAPHIRNTAECQTPVTSANPRF